MQHDVAQLRRELAELRTLYLMLAAIPRLSEQQVQTMITQQLRSVRTALASVGDLAYGCHEDVQIGDAVGVVGDDLVGRADAAAPLLAVGFCVEKSAKTQCLVRRMGIVPRKNTTAGVLYYTSTTKGAASDQDPYADAAAKIFQRLGVGKNSTTLDACVTLQFIRLR